MSKKSFDHIENRVREAAENSESAFDEFAWGKMEALLDKEKDNKRRYIFWWILLPLLFASAGSAYLFFKNKPIKETTLIKTQKKFTEDQSTKIKNIPVESQPLTAKPNDFTKKPALNKIITSELEYAASQLTSNNKNKETIVFAGTVNHKVGKIQQNKKGKLFSNINSRQAESTDEIAIIEDTANVILDATSLNNNENTTPVVLKDSTLKIDSAKIITKISPEKRKTEKLAVNKLSRFYLLATIGADAGSVKFLSLKNSKIAAKYGIGVGYQLNKRMSVQTGFYVGLKKYIAGPGDYKAKQGSYWNVVQIIKVDASCLVYDISVTFRYNFLQKPSTLLYTTTGVSSFIMKKEDYNYYYNRYNTLHNASWTYTGNKTLFAVANFSLGVEKKLSANFSILAEPSVSLPITGVGDGSVKLYSTALQVGLKYYPYRKHK